MMDSSCNLVVESYVMIVCFGQQISLNVSSEVDFQEPSVKSI